MIDSMTLKERRDPNLVASSPSRKRRIANGSGCNVQQVNKLLKDFQMMKKMMKQMKNQQKSFKKGMFGNFPFMK